MQNSRRVALSACAGLFFTATANATVFFIDQFDIQRDQVTDPGTLQPWFTDNFDDGSEPPDSNGTFPTGIAGSYSTLPDPMPGPEQLDGKLRIDTAEGFETTSSVTGVPVLIQRARLLSNTSDADEDLNRGLKETQVFTVKGTFDLIEPTQDIEGYGVRLTDAGSTVRNDNVQLRVVKLGGLWQVQFVEADFDLGVFDVIGSVSLSDITGVDDFEQIALTLTKGSNDGDDLKLISGGFELIDLQGPDLSFAFEDTADIFDGERWTRAAFFAFVAQEVQIPVPATLLLMGAGLAGIGFRRWRQI